MLTDAKVFHYTLINFQDEVVGSEDFEYKKIQAAIARGGKLLWDNDKCARVLIRSDWGFNVTIEWGIREHY